MNRCFALLLAILLIGFSRAFAVELSTTNDAVYFGICGVTTNVPIRFDDKMVWRPFCNTGAVELNYPAAEFGVKVRLWSNDGTEVPKTELGQKYGSKFDQVHTYEDVTQGWQMGRIEATEPYDPRNGALFSGSVFPAAKDLFKIEKPGIYRMELEMQMFRVTRGTNHWDRKLIRFEPIKVKIEKRK